MSTSLSMPYVYVYTYIHHLNLYISQRAAIKTYFELEVGSYIDGDKQH